MENQIEIMLTVPYKKILITEKNHHNIIFIISWVKGDTVDSSQSKLIFFLLFNTWILGTLFNINNVIYLP